MTASLSPPSDLAVEQLGFLQEALATSAALTAADRLGVLQRLSGGAVDPASLAQDCAINERGARLLLAALAGLGIVEAAGDGFYRAVGADLLGLAAMLKLWSHLPEVIRDSRPVVAGDKPEGAAAFYPTVAPRLGIWFADAAELAAEHLGETHRSPARTSSGQDGEVPALRVLDIGAGAAPWSLALARRDNACRVTAVDFPAVLESTRPAVAAAGCEQQVSYLAGDLFEVDFGGAAYDLAIAGNLCHLFDETSNRRLLRRLFDAVRPGGTVAILDALPNERLDGPRAVVLYGLGLLWRTERGQIYPFSTYVGWLRDTGYEAVERLDLGAVLPISLITARRP
jgi:SAM-dependent methyltransferase